MVSEDFPEPDNTGNDYQLCLGMSTEIFFRLCTCAPDLNSLVIGFAGTGGGYPGYPCFSSHTPNVRGFPEINALVDLQHFKRADS